MLIFQDKKRAPKRPFNYSLLQMFLALIQAPKQLEVMFQGYAQNGCLFTGLQLSTADA
jgi:hypothetical protein